eukprot:403376855
MESMIVDEEMKDQVLPCEVFSVAEALENVRRGARSHDEPEEEFRLRCFNKIFCDGESPAYLIKNGYAKRLNIIFDVDHTLVFSVDHMSSVVIANDETIPKISMSNGRSSHSVIVREGVTELLVFLSEFCNFYVYSHGLKDYIMKVLNILDPSQKYFKNREHTVLAPIDSAEQLKFNISKKSIYDIRDPVTGKPLFRNQDVLIIDDQLHAIKQQDVGHLIQSKKFAKHIEKLLDSDSRNYPVYQYGNVQTPYNYTKDSNKHHLDLNRAGERNQLYYIGVMISKLFLNQFTLSPKTPIINLLANYKKTIFSGMKFYLEDFHLNVVLKDRENCNQYKEICAHYIKELGGQTITSKIISDFQVVFLTKIPQLVQPGASSMAFLQNQTSLSSRLKIVNYRYVLDCLFMLVRLDHEQYHPNVMTVKYC